LAVILDVGFAPTDTPGRDFDALGKIAAALHAPERRVGDVAETLPNRQLCEESLLVFRAFAPASYCRQVKAGAMR
jgi:hypothetical protein